MPGVGGAVLNNVLALSWHNFPFFYCINRWDVKNTTNKQPCMSRKEKERKENEIMIISSKRICVLLLLIAMSRRVIFS